MNYLIALLVLAVGHGALIAADDSTAYSFEGHVGGGYVRNLSTFDYAPPGELSQNGFNGYARFMWSPEHLLDVGVEVGITELYAITPPDSSLVDKSSLIAYPLYLVLSMRPVDPLYLTVGFGSAVLSSVVTDAEGNTGVTSVSTSVFLSAAYMPYVTENLRLGGEVRATSFDRYKDFNVSVNVGLAYTLWRY